MSGVKHAHDLEAGGKPTRSAPARALGRPPSAADGCCYICLDDDDDGAADGAADGAPLADICACRSSRVHVVCLEKALNSKKSRARALAELIPKVVALARARKIAN
jgi:hypothetical protein